MNILPFEKQVGVIGALVDGCSIRATERLTGIHRDTIMRLGVRVGEGCAELHDRLMRGLRVNLIEVDEIWSFIGKKQKRLTPEDDADKGDAYVFIALDATRKAILAYRVGKRDGATSNAFMADLRERVLGAPQISTDGFRPYGEAVELAFGTDCHHGAIVKLYHGEPGPDAARRYSPGMVVGVSKATISGSPRRELISTSYVERSNLSLRMACRRFTRLTNGFSKTLRNHEAAVALYVAHYNLCRVHEALRITPAMALGVADHIWTVGELVEMALAPEELPPPRFAPFTVIQGGLS